MPFGARAAAGDWEVPNMSQGIQANHDVAGNQWFQRRLAIDRTKPCWFLMIVVTGIRICLMLLSHIQKAQIELHMVNQWFRCVGLVLEPCQHGTWNASDYTLDLPTVQHLCLFHPYSQPKGRRFA